MEVISTGLRKQTLDQLKKLVGGYITSFRLAKGRPPEYVRLQPNLYDALLANSPGATQETKLTHQGITLIRDGQTTGGSTAIQVTIGD